MKDKNEKEEKFNFGIVFRGKIKDFFRLKEYMLENNCFLIYEKMSKSKIFMHEEREENSNA